MDHLPLGLAMALIAPAIPATAQSPSPDSPAIRNDRIAWVQAQGAAIAPATAPEEPSATRARLTAARRRLDFLSGPWTLTFYNLRRDGEWSATATQDVSVDSSMNDLYLTTRFVTPGFSYEMVFSYDTAMRTYRIVSRDDRSGLMDVYQGDFNADGALVVSNLASGTHFLDRGRRVHNRMTFVPDLGAWRVLIEGTADGGGTWRRQGRGEARQRRAAQ